jgi:hypothetical protein
LCYFPLWRCCPIGVHAGDGVHAGVGVHAIVGVFIHAGGAVHAGVAVYACVADHIIDGVLADLVHTVVAGHCSVGIKDPEFNLKRLRETHFEQCCGS